MPICQAGENQLKARISSDIAQTMGSDSRRFATLPGRVWPALVLFSHQLKIGAKKRESLTRSMTYENPRFIGSRGDVRSSSAVQLARPKSRQLAGFGALSGPSRWADCGLKARPES